MPDASVRRFWGIAWVPRKRRTDAARMGYLWKTELPHAGRDCERGKRNGGDVSGRRICRRGADTAVET